MKNEFKILDIYYQKKFVLFFMVLGSEVKFNHFLFFITFLVVPFKFVYRLL